MIAISVIALYTFATIKMSRRKGELSREALQKYRDENVLMGDSFSNYEAVKVISISMKLVLS
jgi:ABC-type transport system involved in Fe-S cluster assembly fused permease/ATPase subunit